ncbi:MAG: ABC transporter ATP-binding protein [Acetobacteraceae bacterium]|nr:ABC transporter ATP-binding protein [Acetobacteraceae bacterium]
MADAVLSVQGVSKRYGGALVLDQVSLDVAGGEFVTLLGPSGCGKSTLLRLIAGFENTDGGTIHVAGRPMQGVPTYNRPLTMMFQSLALFPNMDVAANVGYGLRVRRVPAAERSLRVGEALDLVGLSGLGARRVSDLSGGQRQRVALARCLVIQPALLLLDEPLGALDLQLRRQLQTELKELQRRAGCAFVYVTHDQEEALSMSDRIALMRSGRIEQIDTPADIYARPRNAFVASFVGEVNLLRVTDLAIAGAGRVAIRPESFRIVENGAAEDLCIAGVLESTTQVSSTLRHRVRTRLGTLAVAELAGGSAVRAAGQTLTLACRAADAVRIDE